MPPAEGERNALGGYLPQYLVGAEKVLHELNAGALDSAVLGDVDAGRLDDFQIARAYMSEEFADGFPNFENSLIVERRMPSITSPDWWLGLHSQAAKEIGLAPDPERPLIWRWDGEVAVRSFWWRSGYLRWPSRSPEDEVGEGWLVLARPEILEMLASTFGAVRRAWRITTSMRDESSGSLSG